MFIEVTGLSGFFGGLGFPEHKNFLHPSFLGCCCVTGGTVSTGGGQHSHEVLDDPTRSCGNSNSNESPKPKKT